MASPPQPMHLPRRKLQPDDFAGAPSDFTVEAAMPAPDAAEEANAARVMDAPPLAPRTSRAPTAAAKFDPGAPEDIETIAARRARQAHADRKATAVPCCSGCSACRC